MKHAIKLFLTRALKFFSLCFLFVPEKSAT